MKNPEEQYTQFIKEYIIKFHYSPLMWWDKESEDHALELAAEREFFPFDPEIFNTCLEVVQRKELLSDPFIAADDTYIPSKL